MTIITALKQHYEYYHAGDLSALKKLYEYHAENCVKAADITVDTQQREEYLKLARQWTEAAAVLQADTASVAAHKGPHLKSSDESSSGLNAGLVIERAHRRRPSN